MRAGSCSSLVLVCRVASILALQMFQPGLHMSLLAGVRKQHQFFRQSSEVPLLHVPGASLILACILSNVVFPASVVH